MLRNFAEAKKYVNDPSGKLSTADRAKNLTVMSMLIKESVDMIFDQVEKIGFRGVEFIEKTEVFLKVTTTSSSDRIFNDIIQTLKDVDPCFQNSKLHFSLMTLRSLNTNKYDPSVLDFIKFNQDQNTDLRLIASELGFFSGFLTEVIIRFMDSNRRDIKNLKISPQEFQSKFDEAFDGMVVNLIQKISQA